MSLVFANGDTLIVSDGRRLSWFALDGSLLRDLDVGIRIRDVKLLGSFEWQLGTDGSILLLGSSPGGPRAGQNWVYLVSEVADDLGLTALAEYELEPGVPTEGSEAAPPTRLQRPFFPTAPAAILTSQPLRVFVADPHRWEVRVHQADGSIESIVRLPIPRAPVTPEWIAEARKQLERRRENHPRLRELLRAYDALSHPDSVPGIVRLYSDGPGHIWLEHYVPSFAAGEVERTFEVLRQNGEWLGRVKLPADIGSILRIHNDRILTRYADDDGVHYARLYAITKQ